MTALDFLDTEGQRQVQGFVAYLQEPGFVMQLATQLAVETPRGFERANPNILQHMLDNVRRASKHGGLHRAAGSLAVLADLYQKFLKDNKHPCITVPAEFLPTAEVLAACTAKYQEYVADCIDSGNLPSH